MTTLLLAGTVGGEMDTGPADRGGRVDILWVSTPMMTSTGMALIIRERVQAGRGEGA